MKILGYIWTVIINIITVAVVLAIFSITSTKFEIVVLAILVLIYLSIWGFKALWGLNQIQFSLALDDEFRTIKKSLSGEITKHKGLAQLFDEMKSGKNLEMEEMNEYEKEVKEERAEKMKNIMTKFYINVGFQTIIYIITLYYLLTAIYS